jgi:type VI secretion system protein ImpB
MGAMSDLSGNAGKEQPAVADRKFTEISVDNFDERMKGIGPGVKMRVPNKLTGEGEIPVELKFEALADFSPAAVAKQVPALAKLLEARQQLANLITYMDGKSGAEELINKILHDKNLLEALAKSPKPADEPAKSE